MGRHLATVASAERATNERERPNNQKEEEAIIFHRPRRGQFLIQSITLPRTLGHPNRVANFKILY